MSAGAATWGTPAVLGSNAYSGSVAIDSAGNLTGVWYQYTSSSGSQINEIWASTAAIGHAWSAPVNISGPIGVASGNPIVRTSASGNATAIYTDPTNGGTYVDHPSGGNWGLPGVTHGVNTFYANNDHGDEGLAWGTGGARPTSSTINAVYRPAGGTWSSAATIAAAPHLNFDGAAVAPDGTMAVAWESFNSVCGSRTCTTSNWVLHVSTLAPGSQTWVDSGALLGPDTTQHFGQIAADALGDLAVVSLHSGNIVSTVRHGSVWSGTAVIASQSAVGFYTGTGRDNRVFASDANGHATLVSWSNGLFNLVAVDGSLVNNTWGKVTTISGSDQNPNYFAFAMSSSGAAIVFYSILPPSGNTIWRAITRSGSGAAWNAPATVGTSFQGGGVPESAAINAAGQAAVVYHGYSSDYLTYIEYSNVYK
jgi:hypothetical protein